MACSISVIGNFAVSAIKSEITAVPQFRGPVYKDKKEISSGFFVHEQRSPSGALYFRVYELDLLNK